ncbi:MAG: extracellular solute-binding protein [Christensenellales bacterium]|jgi:putative aldouronate transport system substrate-binding protein
MKRFLSIVLAVVMLLAIAAMPSLAEEKVKLKVVVSSNIQSFFEGEDENNNYIIRYLEDRTGYDLEWYILPTENGEAKLNAMMASSDEVPDILMIGSGSRDKFLQYAADEMILPLNDYIPNPDDYFRYDTVGANKLGILDGNYYAVSTPGNQSATTFLWWYNDAAVKETGIEIEGSEMTLEDFDKVLHTLKEAYPDKVIMGCASDGTNSPWVNGLQEIYGAFGIANNFRVKEDGTLEYALATEDMKECLVYLNKLYADGILDPEFLVTTKETLLPKLMENSCVSFMGAWYDYTGTYRRNIETVDEQGKRTTSNWKYVNIIDGGRATKGQTKSALNQWYMCVSYACEHPQEAVNLLEVFLDPEYYDICFFGKEGEDYYYDENGVRWRNQDSQIGAGFSFSGTQWYVYYYFTESKDQRIDRLGTGTPYYDFEYVMDAWYAPKEVEDPLAAMPVIEEYQDCKADMDDVAASYFIKFIMGEYSFDQWDAYLNELEAVGLTSVVDALNAWYTTL